jgi:hypothetical protein
MPLCAAWNQGSQLGKPSCLLPLRHLLPHLFPADNNHFPYVWTSLKLAQSPAQYRHTAKQRQEFIEPHAAAAACGDDDGRGHD